MLILYYNVFIHSSVEGYSGGFQFETVIIIHVYNSGCTSTEFFQGRYIKIAMTQNMYICFFVYKAKLFSKVLVSFMVPSATYESLHSSTFLLTIAIVREKILFLIIVIGCGFKFAFSWQLRVSFHMLLTILFVKFLFVFIFLLNFLFVKNSLLIMLLHCLKFSPYARYPFPPAFHPLVHVHVSCM